MATAADYRKWPEECFEWAREARDESVRHQYANLAQVWLECAGRAELRSDVILRQNQQQPRKRPSSTA